MLEYDLSLGLTFPEDPYRGVVTISGLGDEVPLELDASGLDIHSISSGGGPIPFHLDRTNHKLSLDGARPAGQPVTIEFSGRIARGVQTGFFFTRLGDSSAAMTQMEPESCRRLFPCLDRPSAKAVFRLRVTARPDLVVISNGPVRSQSVRDGLREWSFAPTPSMSTYLFFLAVGPFTETETTKDGIRYVVASARGTEAKARNTLRVAEATVRGYTEYYGVPYPLPKLHLVATTDFWVAMENWGAIAGSEGNLMYDDSTPPDLSRFTQETIAHEVAHQWFGNLVTLRTWEDLWLNEAFATFVVPRIQERAHLRQDPWGEFVIRTRRGDGVDSLRTTHAVKPVSVDPAQIFEHADDITYFKGSRLIRMIESYLGEEAFRKGVSGYLRRHQFGNASSQDLWQALEDVSGSSVVATMRAWVERPGIPCVRVRQSGSQLELEQQRFLYLPDAIPESPWPIPLALEVNGVRQPVLFDSRTLTLPLPDDAQVRFDPDRAGYFRLLLEPPLRGRVLRNAMALSPLDRWGLVHDAEAFLLSGEYTLEEFRDTLVAIQPAREAATLREAVESLHDLVRTLWDSPPLCDLARGFCRALLDQIAMHPAAGEPQAIDQVREDAVVTLSLLDEEFGRSLSKRFDGIDREPPSLRRGIATASAKYGSADTVERLLRRARGTDSEGSFTASLALEGLDREDSLRKILDDALDGRVLRSNLFYLVRAVAYNPGGRATWWDWWRANARRLERVFEGSYELSLLLTESLPFVGLGREPEVQAYFEHERFAEAELGARHGLELLKTRTRLRSRVGRASGPAREPTP